jgi:hypothetical protein
LGNSVHPCLKVVTLFFSSGESATNILSFLVIARKNRPLHFWGIRFPIESGWDWWSQKKGRIDAAFVSEG